MSYLLDPYHQRVLEGDRSALKKPHLSTILITVPILLIVGLYSLSVSITTIIHGVALNTYGITATGIIIDKKMFGNGGRGTHWRTSYSFFANDNRLYVRQAEIDGNTYYNLNIGDQVDVKYMNGNPNDSHLNKYDPEERNTIGGGFAAGIPTFAVAILGLITAKMRLHSWKRLKTYGQLIEGQVLSVREEILTHHSVPYYRYFVLRYQFNSPSNRQITGKVKFNYEPPDSQIETGTSLVVIYVHDRLYQVL